MIYRWKKWQSGLKQIELTLYNAAQFSRYGHCGRTSKERCIKQYYFSNRLSGFTGDQSYHGCLQVGAQGKNLFTGTVRTLFGSGGFEKIRTYLEHGKHSENGLTESLKQVVRTTKTKAIMEVDWTMDKVERLAFCELWNSHSGRKTGMPTYALSEWSSRRIKDN